MPKTYRFSDCRKVQKELKDTRRLCLIFDRTKSQELHRKFIVFESTEDRDSFCKLIHAGILTGSTASTEFKKLDSKNEGFVSAETLKKHNYLDQLGYSDEACPEKVDFFSFLHGLAAQQNSLQAKSPQVSKRPSRIFSPSQISGLSASAAAEVSASEYLDGDGLVKEELEMIHLLSGEIPTIQQQHTARLDGNSGSRGTLILTNYRLAYREYSDSRRDVDDGNLDIPLGYIAKINKGESESTVNFYCKDYRLIRFGFDASAHWVNAFLDSANKWAFPKDQNKLFAFSYTLDPAGGLDGWKLYDETQEYERIGLASNPKFRLVDNKEFKISPTYPPVFVVPSQVNEQDLVQICKYRGRGRAPAVVWLHPNGACLARCAQPLVGLKRQSNDADQKYFSILQEINHSNKKLYIVDARPYKAAVGNTVMGKGYEKGADYKDCQIIFCGIDNIHAVRNSMQKLMELLYSEDDTGTNLSKPLDPMPSTYGARLEATGWLHYIRLILTSAARMALMIEKEGASVVTHCSDGWDRTSQLVALCELMLDPFYRTLAGFAILIEKEWTTFGHKFAERFGHGDPKSEHEQRAPIFIQFVDTVYQLTRQFPSCFEFNDIFLLQLIDHVYSCRFGTFLFNNVKERIEKKVKQKTPSLWTHMLSSTNRWKYRNAFYKSYHGVLIPNCHPKRIVLWEELYSRWDMDIRLNASVSELSTRLYVRHERLHQKLISPHHMGEESHLDQKDEDILRSPQRGRVMTFHKEKKIRSDKKGGGPEDSDDDDSDSELQEYELPAPPKPPASSFSSSSFSSSSFSSSSSYLASPLSPASIASPSMPSASSSSSKLLLDVASPISKSGIKIVDGEHTPPKRHLGEELQNISPSKDEIKDSRAVISPELAAALSPVSLLREESGLSQSAFSPVSISREESGASRAALSPVSLSREQSGEPSRLGASPLLGKSGASSSSSDSPSLADGDVLQLLA